MTRLKEKVQKQWKIPVLCNERVLRLSSSRDRSITFGFITAIGAATGGPIPLKTGKSNTRFKKGYTTVI